MNDRPFITLDSSLAAQTWQSVPGRHGMMLRCEAGSLHTTLVDSRSRIMREWDDPLEGLQWMADHVRSGECPSNARWIGYLSYDLGRLFERLPAGTKDDLTIPLFVFTYHEESDKKIDPDGSITAPPTLSLPASNFSRDEYLSAVEKAIGYIAAGDIFQVNLSQRFMAKLQESPRIIYERMKRQSPAWYGAFLEYADFALLCNSPELFLRITPDGKIVTRPIKGTRPRMAGMDAELRDSIKDQAELNMIIDLERNDLGRICRIGSVHVTEPRMIETHPTVYHGAATVEGMLRQEVGFVDVLRATFPGGSITGAPKIRAMEIIDELEPTRRGAYCGAIGYLSASGVIEFNIAIRTMIAKAGRIYIPVGGGIVADSTPLGEYEETLVKARAMFAAVGLY